MPKVTKIKLTGMYSPELQPNSKTLELVCSKHLFLRTARKIGDTEVINNFVLGKIKKAKKWGWLDYEVVE